MTLPTRPILVCMVWRGGARFERCLESIARSMHHFNRIVLSITSAPDSADMRNAVTFQSQYPEVEVICTQRELPTMEHQSFWIEYLEQSGATRDDWIYWLAYDDEVRPRGIDAITDTNGGWPLYRGTVYFGPWAMRHERPDHLWDGDPAQPLERWTSFPTNGPHRLPVMEWIADQIAQPTYMQMSGSVCPLGNFIEVKEGTPAKRGPMRIEMATALGRTTTHVEEFSEPVSIIYGRPDSDRASYGARARREDVHLLAWLSRYTAFHPGAAPHLARLIRTATAQQAKLRARHVPLPSEEWRVQGECLP